jgi:hypothetical protein
VPVCVLFTTSSATRPTAVAPSVTSGLRYPIAPPPPESRILEPRLGVNGSRPLLHSAR